MFNNMKFASIIVFFSLNVFCEETDSSTLELVHVFFRHGNRTPDKKDIYPTDLHAINDFRPTGYGQLTNDGKLRAYQLGNVLRRRYKDFLGETYTPEVVRTQTTDYDRTKMSALLVLAALFPPSSSQKWNEDLSWMPIPYHYEKASNDYVHLFQFLKPMLELLCIDVVCRIFWKKIANLVNIHGFRGVNYESVTIADADCLWAWELRRPNAYCPAYMRELENVLASDIVKRVLKEHSSTFQYVSKHAGRRVEKLSDMFNIFQVLHSEENMNLTLPKWTDNVYPDVIRHLASQQCLFENYNPILKRLNGGRMLKKVVDNMVEKSKGILEPQGRKIFLYSAHDNNVINILAALKLYEPHFPNYSAAVLIELYRVNATNEYFVKILYSKDVSADPEEQAVPKCGTFCPLVRFLQVTEPHLPVNFTKECDSAVFLD